MARGVAPAGGIRCVNNVAVKIRGEVEVESRLPPVNVAGGAHQKIGAHNGADGRIVRFAVVKHRYGETMKDKSFSITDKETIAEYKAEVWRLKNELEIRDRATRDVMRQQDDLYKDVSLLATQIKELKVDLRLAVNNCKVLAGAVLTANEFKGVIFQHSAGASIMIENATPIARGVLGCANESDVVVTGTAKCTLRTLPDEGISGYCIAAQYVPREWAGKKIMVTMQLADRP